jgi:hypothetical protein
VTYRRYRRYFKKATQNKLYRHSIFYLLFYHSAENLYPSDSQIVVVDFAAAIEYGTPIAITTFPKKQRQQYKNKRAFQNPKDLLI